MVPPAGMRNNKSANSSRRIGVDLAFEQALCCFPPRFQVRVIRRNVERFAQISTKLEQPTLTVVVEVDRTGVIEQRGIESHQPPAQWSIQSGGRFLCFDEPDFLLECD